MTLFIMLCHPCRTEVVDLLLLRSRLANRAFGADFQRLSFVCEEYCNGNDLIELSLRDDAKYTYVVLPDQPGTKHLGRVTSARRWLRQGQREILGSPSVVEFCH